MRGEEKIQMKNEREMGNGAYSLCPSALFFKKWVWIQTALPEE